MKSTSSLVAILATYPFRLVFASPTLPSSALLPRQDDEDPEFDYPGPLQEYVAPETAPGACADKNDYSTVESRGNIWWHSAGDDITENYLQQNKRDKWQQEIFKIMFPNDQPSNFDCTSQGAICTVPYDCGEFKKRNWPGVFYIFSSLQNIHTFFSEFETRLHNLKADMTNDISILAHDFGADVETEDTLNFFAMMGAALGMSAGITAADPFLSGTLGAVAGFSGLIANSVGKPNKDSGLYKLGKIESELAGIVNMTIEDSLENVHRISGAIFGVPGSDEADIPKQMMFDAGRGYKHSIPQVFANGQWLLDTPTQGLELTFDKVGRQFRQALAWNLLRLFHNAFVIIIDNITNASDCAKNPNFVWDFKWSWCWGLAVVTDKDENGEPAAPRLKNIGDVAKPLWEKYGAEPFPTYRNTYDCWQANKAHLGPIDLDADSAENDITRCFFGMEMKKGSIEGTLPANFFLRLDQGWENFPEDAYVDNNGKKIPNTCVDVDHCDQWPVSHRWDMN